MAEAEGKFDFESMEGKFTDELFDTLREGFLVLNTDLRVEMANTAFCNLFKIEEKKLKGISLYALINRQFDIPKLRKLLEEILPEKKTIDDFQVEHKFPGIGHRILLLNARQIDDVRLILLAFEDATDRIEAKREAEEAKDKLEERVRERTRQVRKLASQLTVSEQNERQRISELLHGDLQQVLFAIRLTMNLIQRRINEEGITKYVEEKITEVTEMTVQALEITRQLSHDLNPPVLKSEELTIIVNWLAKRFEEMYNLETTVEAESNFLIPGRDLRILILKIVRELLFNIVKHSDTDEALIEIENSKQNQLIIRVIDQGGGFDIKQAEARKGFGLFSIRERLNLLGGSFEVHSAVGKESRMIVKLPLGDNIIIRDTN
ncbi:MAG TPA: ATP-binding protein [Balneolaceae bacterium]|nr:ATP-binding protein [Balneolaceae bacterium]